MPNTTDLPNPFTPLAFLPPTLASQVEVSRYVYAATLGAYVWDIGLNLGNDYALLFKRRFSAPDELIRIRRRLSTLAYIITFFVFQAGPVKNCNALAVAFGISVVFTQSTTALLFFLRVTAVWHESKLAYAVFSILWMAVLGAGISAPLGIRAAHIGPTAQCIPTVIPNNIEAAAIVPLINDTAVFLAINYRILAHTIVADSSLARLRAFLGVKEISTLSRALIQSGQHFYLVAVAANITLLAAFRLSPVIHSMLSVPAFTVVNAMACLVFRRIKFGLISSDGVSKIPMTGLSENFHATANPRSFSLHLHHTDPTIADSGTDTTVATFPLEVRMQTVVHGFTHSTDAHHEISKPTDLA
ncbi:hypothetical protein MSAN_02382100 [Mycena sanguinolenta]|uniref:Uncharacterized protein n=1 Tax=Mycena sanguinolenta TaxID=230812 RepID=A0A8H6X4I7_9AGAR|nr:hypothetical protein MSAN_02382100 [Mycena sanguinolenta]